MYRAIVVGIGLWSSWSAPAAISDTAASARLLWLELSAEPGTVLSWEGTEFVEAYRQATQAPLFPRTFPPGEALSGGLRIPLDSAWKVRLGFGFWQLQLDHTYQQSLREEQRQGERVVRALLQLNYLPVWLGVEWQPIQTQFRTYLHAAAGIVPLKFLWQETVKSAIPEDTRSGGTYRNGWLVRPGIRLVVGTALSFDAAARGSLLESLRLEAGYAFVPLRDPALEPLRPQLPAAVLPAQHDFWLSGSMLTLSLALVLQLPMRVL